MSTLSLTAPRPLAATVKFGTLLGLWNGLREIFARRAFSQRETRFNSAKAGIYLTAATGGTPQRSSRGA
ncbi:hypothetical protein shim_18490 [Shimia sp. SK013]|nr:hypothetical protein shim_18490 [Shimia sp. SK013]